MEGAPYIPKSGSELRDESPLDYETLPPTGVRKVLNAFEERDLSRIRWSAVVAGLFLAVATQLVLGLLGVAIGLSAAAEGVTPPLEAIGVGTGVYMAVASLVSLFVGGYAAAKLSGSIRRVDGALAGVLTWAASLVVTLFLLGSSLDVTGQRRLLGINLNDLRAEAAQMAPGTQAGADRAMAADAAGAAWGAFVGAIVSLVAATVGGVVGSVGSGKQRRYEDHGRRYGARDRRESEAQYLRREPGKPVEPVATTERVEQPLRHEQPPRHSDDDLKKAG